MSLSNESPLFPLLAARDIDAPLAWQRGVAISGRTYLADVARQAELLPARGPLVNLCNDRYAFAVALGAALVRGHASLLPPDARPETMARLRESHGDVVAITDEPSLEVSGLERVLVPHGAAGALVSVDPSVAPRPSPRSRADVEPTPVPSFPGDMHAVSLLTSGSTGVPQPHAKQWRTLVGDIAAAAGPLANWLGRASLTGMTLVATVPVQHSYGLESSALLAMLGGAAFDSGRPFFPSDIVQALASVPQPRALVTTPFHLKTLMLSGLAIPPVDLILSATAPLSPQLAAQAEQATGGVLVEIYGSTESGQVASRRPTASEVWETFGDIRVRARSAPAASDAVAAEQFVFEGDFIPQPTPMADVLELLDDRRFRLFGRSNDLIHVAGKRSSLGHLNYHLNSIPGVEDGAFWLPEEVADGIVRPVAFVVAPTLAPGAVIAELRHRIESVFVPRRVVQVRSLPREGTGKLTARALREFALSQMAADDTPVHVTHDVPAGHPVFAGHFPGQPLLPGALLVSEVMEAMVRVPAMVARLGAHPTLAAVKFLAPVRPGATIDIALHPEAGASRGVRFEVRCGPALAASGRWVAGEAAVGAAG